MQEKQATPQDNKNSRIAFIERRDFITTMTKAAGGAALLLIPPAIHSGTHGVNKISMTAGDIMDLFIEQVPGAPFMDTVDTLKAGSRDITVTGIVTTMFATVEVIEKTVAAGANFIITHEPVFYNHTDDTAWLQDDDVYQYKSKLLSTHNITVWRNHDYIHSLAADGVREGVLAQLNWKQYDKGKGDNLIITPPVSLQALIDHAKDKLKIQQLRYIGDLRQACSKILLMPGASGGRNQIQSIIKNKPDTLVCGEISEWETAEYVRDARAKGSSLSLVVLGHIASEEPGSIFMAGWLKTNVPGVPVTQIAAGNSLSFA